MRRGCIAAPSFLAVMTPVTISGYRARHEKNHPSRCAEVPRGWRRCRCNDLRPGREAERPPRRLCGDPAHRLVGPALGQGLRRPTHRRSRRRHVPQSGVLGRSSRSHHPQGWRRLLDDVLVVRLIPGHRRLAFARSRELERRGSGTDASPSVRCGPATSPNTAAATSSTSRRAPRTRRSNYVVHAASMRGPWSEPIDLNLPAHIDPGHIVGEDGKRYLFLSGGDRVKLKDDGLATDGAVEHVYDPWRYPDDWVVESFSPEGPKVLRHGKYFYMVTAVGGTAGPPTGHMVIAARSKSINGPWENCPANPLVRTTDAREKWWSRGHASLVEGPGRRLVERLSRLRKRVLDARPPDAARSHRVDRRRLVPLSRQGSFAAAFRSPRSSRTRPMASRCRTTSARTSSAFSGRSTRRARTNARAWRTRPARW